jgi:hexokinase
VELIGTRAARLAAAAISGIVLHTKVGQKGVDIGIDGALYELYPSFKDRIYQGISELMPEFADDIENIVRLGLARDGSGVGAALTACVADKMLRSK